MVFKVALVRSEVHLKCDRGMQDVPFFFPLSRIDTMHQYISALYDYYLLYLDWYATNLELLVISLFLFYRKGSQDGISQIWPSNLCPRLRAKLHRQDGIRCPWDFTPKSQRECDQPVSLKHTHTHTLWPVVEWVNSKVFTRASILVSGTLKYYNMPERNACRALNLNRQAEMRTSVCEVELLN